MMTRIQSAQFWHGPGRRQAVTDSESTTAALSRVDSYMILLALNRQFRAMSCSRRASEGDEEKIEGDCESFLTFDAFEMHTMTSARPWS